MGGRVVGGGGGNWETEGGPKQPCTQRNSHCVFSKTQKQPQCTCQAQTVVGDILRPTVALLVCPSSTIRNVMDLYCQKNATCESRPGNL